MFSCFSTRSFFSFPAAIRVKSDTPTCKSSPSQYYRSRRGKLYFGVLFFDDRKYRVWHKDGRLHRLYGPASVCYKNGNLVNVKWYVNGKSHRTNGPAITYYEGTMITDEWWFSNGIIQGKAGIYSSFEDQVKRLNRSFR